MAEFVRFRCSRCNKSLKAPPAHAGKKCVCACGAKMRVPDDEELVEAIPDDEPAAAPRQRNRWLATITLTLVLPIVITIVGGLAVEYLKPREGSPKSNAVAAADVAPAAPAGQTHPYAKLILGKWSAESSGVLFGEISVEFSRNGQMVRKHQEGGIEFSEALTYSIDASGQLSTNPATNVRLINVSDSDLTLSWPVALGQRSANYKRPWTMWHFGLAAGAFCILAVIGKILESKLK